MRIVVEDQGERGPVRVIAEPVGRAWQVRTFRNGFATGTIAAGGRPGDIAVLALLTLNQALSEPAEICTEHACPVPATHERLTQLVHGTPVFELTCARHGDRVRS